MLVLLNTAFIQEAKRKIQACTLSRPQQKMSCWQLDYIFIGIIIYISSFLLLPCVIKDAMVICESE